jgi:hypothetical protein
VQREAALMQNEGFRCAAGGGSEYCGVEAWSLGESRERERVRERMHLQDGKDGVNSTVSGPNGVTWRECRSKGADVRGRRGRE